MRCRTRTFLAAPLLLVFVIASCAGPPENTTTITPVPPGALPPPASGSAPPISAEIFPAPGATSFTTANARELLSSGSQGGYTQGANGKSELDSDSAAGGARSPSPMPPVQPAPPEAIPDPTREIVEADIYKLEGNLLYLLNRYRGLVIIDVSNPDRMVVRGRLAFQAAPVEMYVRDGRAYIVSSDYFRYWQYDKDADPHGFHGSQVMIADVSNPARPTTLGSFQIDGEVTDTRMVGDVLYSVSKRRADYWRYNTADWKDQTWITSINVANPKSIRAIDKVTFSGTSTLIHVAHHAIFVAAWDPNFYLTSPGLEQETLVTYVDISDANGQIKKRGKVYIPGQIADKFKMNWHEGHLRVLSQRWNGGDDITLNVVSTAHPDILKIDATLPLASVLKRSGLQATRFSGARAFAFSNEYISGNRTRYLHAIDLSKPLSPTVAGKLAVSVDASHVQVHGDRLLVLGRHYQYTSWPYRGDSRVAVALFDVSKLSAMRELSLARLGEGWSSSVANNDYKAFKAFPKLGLLLVPLRYYVQGKSFNGVQLVDWKSDVITERGRVESTGGVQRAFPVGNRLIAVGQMAVVAIDASDRDKPTVTRQLKLVHAVSDVFKIRGLQVQLTQDPYTSQVRLEVRSFGEKDDGPTLATLDLPFSGTPFVLRDGDMLHLIGRELGKGQVVRTADMTDPKRPRLRGELTLTDAFATVFHPGWSWYAHYWSPTAGLPLRNQIVPATFRKVITLPSGRREWQSELRFLDLRDPDNPRIAKRTVPMNDFPFVNKVTHGNVLYSTHVEQATSKSGASLLYHVRAYVDRVDVSDPDRPKALPSVNIPGYLVDVSDDGKLWYTVDYQWDDFGRRRNSVNVLQLLPDGKTAKLITVIPVADQINRAALRPGQLSEKGGRPTGWNDRTIWLTAHKYPWWGVKSDTVASRQPYTVIRRVDFTATGTVALMQNASMQGYHFDLLDVDNSKMYLSSTGPNGLLVTDLSKMATPAVISSSRTIGYISRIVLDGQTAYAPLGMYGLQQY